VKRAKRRKKIITCDRLLLTSAGKNKNIQSRKEMHAGAWIIVLITISKKIRRLMTLTTERGQSMTEYVLIIALIVGVIFAAFQIFGPQLQGALSAIGLKIAGAAAK